MLGTNSSITVTILKNDDINGVFTFNANNLVVRNKCCHYNCQHQITVAASP